MNDNRRNVKYNEDGIDLRELFTVLWKRKIMLISIALIGAVLAGMFSMFILSPVYDTDLKIDLNIPQTYITKYGEYKLPISTNVQYIDLITSNDVIANTIKDMGYSAKGVKLESLKKRISLSKVSDTTQNIFDITVSADNPKESLKLAQNLYDNYIEYVDNMTKGRALSYYYDTFSAGLESQELLLKSTKEILNKNEKVLSKTPQTINQGELAKIGGNVVIENIIDPAYKKLKESIAENKLLINITEDNIRAYKGYLEELDSQKKAMATYNEIGETSNNGSGLVNIAKTNISLLSIPVAPIQKTSPSNSRNAAIGLILGGMLGCGIALIKEYWFKKV